MKDKTDYKLFERVAFSLHDKVTVAGIESLSPDEQAVILVWYTQGMVGNGGFACFYQSALNSCDAAEAYERIGLNEAADACRESARAFPGGVPPPDAADRIGFLMDRAFTDQLGLWDRSDNIINGLDMDDVNAKAARFIREHNLDVE